MSWAMIKSIMSSFNDTCVANYVDNCWYMIQENKPENFSRSTRMHICSAYMMHTFSGFLKRKNYKYITHKDFAET